MPNQYVDLARNTLAQVNILPPTDSNLIVTAYYGTITANSGNNLIPSQQIELQFRVRQDKKPEIYYNDAPPELTKYIKGQSVNPVLLPDWVEPGQKYKGTLNGKNGYLIIHNTVRNPHGIHTIIGDKMIGRFIFNLV